MDHTIGASLRGVTVTTRILCGDSREMLATLPDGSVQTCVTSPPYFGLRDYGHEGQIGLEATVQDYLANLVSVFREVRRILADDGTLWVNLGDTYSRGPKRGDGRSRLVPTLPAKNLMGIPWWFAFAMQDEGWILRRDIIWHKPVILPENVSDRCTTDHEYLFHFAKNGRYYYNADAIAEPASPDSSRASKYGTRISRKGANASVYHVSEDMPSANERMMAAEPHLRNKRSVWSVPPTSFSEAHFATFPPKLIEPCILAGSRPGDTVLDPFGGAGTTGLVADRLGRDSILIELNPEYAEMARRRITNDAPMFASVEVS